MTYKRKRDLRREIEDLKREIAELRAAKQKRMVLQPTTVNSSAGATYPVNYTITFE